MIIAQVANHCIISLIGERRDVMEEMPRTKKSKVELKLHGMEAALHCTNVCRIVLLILFNESIQEG